MMRKLAHNAVSTTIKAFSKVFENAWEMVFEPALDIVIAGIGIALLTVMAVIIFSMRVQAFNAIAILGSSFILYGILNQFEKSKSNLFTLSGMIFMPFVISVVLASIAAGATIELILPIALSSMTMGLGTVIALSAAGQIAHGFIKLTISAFSSTEKAD